MNKLYMISLGGKAPGANIEVHDVQFVVAASIEEAIPMVRDHWYGDAFKLHMDSYLEVTGAHGYALELVSEPVDAGKRLFFTYLGGYKEVDTQEVHGVRLWVTGSEGEAKKLANEADDFDYVQSHVDSVVDVEKVLLAKDGQRHWIKLIKTDKTYDLKPDWYGYKRLDI